MFVYVLCILTPGYLSNHLLGSDTQFTKFISSPYMMDNSAGWQTAGLTVNIGAYIEQT